LCNPFNLGYSLNYCLKHWIHYTIYIHGSTDPDRQKEIRAGDSLLGNPSNDNVDGSQRVDTLPSVDPFFVSNGVSKAVDVLDIAHSTIEISADESMSRSSVSLSVLDADVSIDTEHDPLSDIARNLTVEYSAVDSTDFMLLELGGVTYAIDTSTSSQHDTHLAEDFATNAAISAPLVAGSWTEVVFNTAQDRLTPDAVESLNPALPPEPNPSLRPEPNPNSSRDVFDDPRQNDNNSWTP